MPGRILFLAGAVIGETQGGNAGAEWSTLQ